MTSPPASDRSVTALVVTVLVGYALLAYAAIAPGLNVFGALLGFVLTLGVVAVQVGYVSRPGVRHTREATALALLALACLVYVPVVALSVGWIGFAGFLAGSLLVLLPPRAGLAGVAVVLVSVGLLVGFAGGSWLPVLTAAVGTLVTGLVVHGLTRWWALTSERVVVEEPSVVPPAAAAGDATPEDAQQDGADPEPEGDEESDGADEPGEKTAEEPADEEPAAGPPDRPALAVGLGTARAELDAAGVELSVLGEDVDLPEEAGTLFAALLRVAVEHAARHADATSCHVTVVRRSTEARIVVTHDGATEDPDPEDFEALGERFDAADGSVLAERDDTEFTVEGRLPVRPDVVRGS